MAVKAKDIDEIIAKTDSELYFRVYYAMYSCWTVKVNEFYRDLIIEEGNKDEAAKLDLNKVVLSNTKLVYNNKLSEAQDALRICLQQEAAKDTPQLEANQNTDTSNDTNAPFDKRLQRVFIDKDGSQRLVNPFDAANAVSSINGYMMSFSSIANNHQLKNKIKILRKWKEEYNSARKDNFYTGVPSISNLYSITKLYGSNGGEYLINQKDKRKWYEVDTLANFASNTNFSNIPTTSNIISWGNADPYGRTPYTFSDFVFSKWWNIIPNNRMITLRRFAAPIVDNMKFQGMDGATQAGGTDSQDQGSGTKSSFPPAATVVTYFGEETGNTISSMLKFSVGMNWGEVKSNIFEVNTTMPSVDPNDGQGKMFGGLANMAKMLNIAIGNYDREAINNSGNLPPDPYADGPYTNRILGPVNRIDSVRKRDAGLKFDHTINLTFEYVARPIGGINTKAALLDIISNFLVLGYASAMFWGGQHRFMDNPQKYPFIGGDKGMAAWYKGNPKGFAEASIDSFSKNLTTTGGKIAEFSRDFFNTILGGKGSGNFMNDLSNLFTGQNISGNLIREKMARMGNGQVPYLSGLKALLIGEPVGEWHLTIGNPLNPIAMIGNLICTNMEFEFGEELGPDDFPTTLKVNVKLEHGMPRDRDAVESIFNRGMGRIYDLPDEFAFESDSETRVDNVTGLNRDKFGSPIGGRDSFLASSGTTGRKFGQPIVTEPSNSGQATVWNRNVFNLIPEDSPVNVDNRTTYKSLGWIAKKSLK